MKRKITVLYFVFVYCLVSGCASPVTDQPTPEQTIIKDFASVVINTPGELTISQGETESLEILGDPNLISSIRATVVDRTLTISSEQEAPTNAQITYQLYVKDLSNLTLNSFGVVKIPAYESSSLKLVVNSSGRIDLGNIKVDNLELNINSSGNISADSISSTALAISSRDSGSVALKSGQTVDLKLDFGSGTFLGEDFKSTNATVSLIGSGIIHVWATEKMDVNINGTGSVTYFGEPTLSMSINGGGQLTGGGNK